MIHFLKTEKTARIVTEGCDNLNLKNIWLIMHGYGYLAPYFIKKFNSLFTSEHLIIVPEALHRFYLNGVTEKVGASWMTKEEREHEIEDNNLYLNKVFEKYISPIKKDVCINVLGFSQGAGAACRWVLTTNHKISNCIIWGSTIPPELTKEQIGFKNTEISWLYVAGDKDEFISVEKQKEQVEILEDLGIVPTILFYKGSHDINNETLNLLTQKCVKKA